MEDEREKLLKLAEYTVIGQFMVTLPLNTINHPASGDLVTDLKKRDFWRFILKKTNNDRNSLSMMNRGESALSSKSVVFFNPSHI
jgi:hypothetical protein